VYSPFSDSKFDIIANLCRLPPIATMYGWSAATSNQAIGEELLKAYSERIGETVTEIYASYRGVNILPDSDGDNGYVVGDLRYIDAMAVNLLSSTLTADTNIHEFFYSNGDGAGMTLYEEKSTVYPYYIFDNGKLRNQTYPYIVYALLDGKIGNQNRFQFDVYLDGTTEPTIDIQWSRLSSDDDWNSKMTNPHMWYYPLGNVVEEAHSRYYLDTDKNVIVPSTDDSLALFNVKENWVDGGNRKMRWKQINDIAFNGWGSVKKFAYLLGNKVDLIELYLRIDYYAVKVGQCWTRLFQVRIPSTLPDSPDDISIIEFGAAGYDESKWGIDWDVSVKVHYGTKPVDAVTGAEGTEDDDEKEDSNHDNMKKTPYEDNKTPTSSDYEMGDGTSVSNILTKTYALTSDRCKSLGDKLWSQSYFNVLKVQNNPIENIVSVKAFPFSISGTESDIVIGDVSMGVNGLSCASNAKISIGSIKVAEKYNNFLDYAPFTKIVLFLPYIGFKQLDTSRYMNTTLKVEYVVDYLTGACKVICYSDGIPCDEFDGTMGIDIPLTSSDRAQTDLKHLQSAINTGASLLNKDVLGAANTALSGAQLQYDTQSTSGGSPSCASYSCRNIYLIYDRPKYSDITAFNHTHGRVCNLTKTLGNLTGFTKVTRLVDLKGISATEQELQILRDLLSTGIIL
jgi:hypothetical protein